MSDLARYRAGAKGPEANFQDQVIDLAILYDWEVLHILPGATKGGKWRSPVTGSLGVGWPDLTLVKDGRVIFAELKSATGKLTADQSRVLETLRKIPGATVQVWRPDDLEHIAWLLANA